MRLYDFLKKKSQLLFWYHINIISLGLPEGLSGDFKGDLTNPDGDRNVVWLSVLALLTRIPRSGVSG